MQDYLRKILGLPIKHTEVHDIKNQFTEEMLKVHNEAQRLRKQAQKLERRIQRTTAYKIARASGTLREEEYAG